MHSKSVLSFAAASVLLLEGCAVLPSFSGPPVVSMGAQHAKSAPIPTVDDVLRHIQCEIWRLPRPSSSAPASEQPFADLWNDEYVVYAILTVDVTDNGQINPTLNFIHLLSAATTNRTISIVPQLGSAAHRSFMTTFVLDLKPYGNGDAKHADYLVAVNNWCTDSKGGVSINGDLGIREIVAEGLRHTKSADFIFPVATENVSSAGLPTQSTVASFGSTIDFTLTYGLGGGPTWTLVHFTGPAGTSNPLLNYTRTHKDTLILAFASILPPPGAAKGFAPIPGRAAAAAAIARQHATLSILQHVIPLTP